MIANCRKSLDRSSVGAILCRNAENSHRDIDKVNSKKFFELKVLGLPFRIRMAIISDEIAAIG